MNYIESILKEFYGDNIDDVKDKEKVEFKKEGLYLYVKNQAQPIGPVLDFLYILYDHEKKERQIATKFDIYQYFDFEIDPKVIEKRTKIPVVSWSLYKKYILQEIQKLDEEKKYKILCTRTGWYEENFAHPALDIYEDLFVFDLPKGFIERFVINNPKSQHEIVTHALTNANALAILYLCAISSLLIKDLKCHSFSVLLTGGAGVGKTTIAKLACNLFYDAKQEIDIHATKTAQERIMYLFTDLPVLFDELANLQDMFVEQLLFMIASGQTKKRSNIALKINFENLRNVVFLTSEREVQLTRQGAQRRFLHVPVLQRVSLPLNVDECLDFTGAGIDYIKFYIHHKNEILSEIQKNLEKIKKVYDISEQNIYQIPVLAALTFVEKFYATEFYVLRDKIFELFDIQKQEEDYLQYCIQKFKDWISDHISNFYAPSVSFFVDREGVKHPKIPQRFWGFLDCNIIKKNNSDRIEILLSIESFNNFCTEKNIDRQTFLALAQQNQVLVCNDRYYYKTGKKPLDIPIYRFIAFLLPKFDLIENTNDHEDPF